MARIGLIFGILVSFQSFIIIVRRIRMNVALYSCSIDQDSILQTLQTLQTRMAIVG